MPTWPRIRCLTDRRDSGREKLQGFVKGLGAANELPVGELEQPGLDHSIE